MARSSCGWSTPHPARARPGRLHAPAVTTPEKWRSVDRWTSPICELAHADVARPRQDIYTLQGQALNAIRLSGALPSWRRLDFEAHSRARSQLPSASGQCETRCPGSADSADSRHGWRIGEIADRETMIRPALYDNCRFRPSKRVSPKVGMTTGLWPPSATCPIPSRNGMRPVCRRQARSAASERPYVHHQ